MKILLTGAFGNIGVSTLHKLLPQGHTVRCFDLKTRANQKTVKKFAGQVEEVMWGDIRHPNDVKRAVAGQEVVIHLAAVIPPLSDTRPDLALAVNVGGTENLITALQSLPTPAKLIYASSIALFGRTQDKSPPRTVDNPIQPTDNYTHHKARGEEMVKESGLEWAILRFGAVLRLAILTQIDPLMFEVPLSDRIEFAHTGDVGLALANAVKSDQIWGRTLLIGGGPECQLYQRDIIAGALEAMGIGMLPEEAFSSTPYHTDWMDTSESQRLLDY
ncbi:MAG: NAD-dependent epimerase/dehydratase family protein, partial [Anaerolineales bacterium]